MSRAMYSKYFAFDFLKGKLSTIQQFLGWNIVSGVSIVVCSFPVIFGSAMIVYNDTQKA